MPEAPLGGRCGPWSIASSTRASPYPQGDTPYLIRTYAPRSQEQMKNAHSIRSSTRRNCRLLDDCGATRLFVTTKGVLQTPATSWSFCDLLSNERSEQIRSPCGRDASFTQTLSGRKSGIRRANHSET